MHEATIQAFIDDGLIETVLRPLKQGKEASVHLCQSNPETVGHDLTALKIFHDLDQRDFRDEGLYRDGEFIKERRVRLALEKRTRFGRVVQGGLWVSREWETLQKLSATSTPVPSPLGVSDPAILMTFVGDADMAAPRLQELRRLSPAELGNLWDQILAAVTVMLFNDVVHADLSSYNVLAWDGEVTIIDFPQAVDPKLNRHAEEFLRRDITRIGEWFERRGFSRPWDQISAGLWTSWLHADLIPPDLRGT